MKPLLAEKVDLEKLNFPYLVSPKFDGFRCLITAAGEPVTRSLKAVPNAYVRGKLSEWRLNYLDGELLTLTNGKVDDFNTVQSKLSSRSGMPDFVFKVFDHYQRQNSMFVERLLKASEIVRELNNPRVEVVEHDQVHDLDELMAQEQRAVDAGWEGLMLRHPRGVYKFGRSTVNEGILLKMKRLDDSEGVVVGVQERMHNANEATTSNLGYTERSSHKSNMVPTNSLGALRVRWRDMEFDLGTGFSESQRQEYWAQDLVGRLVTFKYQGVGSGGKPRFPTFKGFRAQEDL